MPGSFHCPRCGQRYALKEGMAGRQVACQKCGTKFRVEAPKPAASPASDVAPQPTPSGAASGMDDLFSEALGPTIPAAAPSTLASGPVLGAGRPKPRGRDKRLLAIVASAGAAVLVLVVILVAVMMRRGATTAGTSTPGDSPPGQRKVALPAVTATTEVPAGVIAPADLNPNTVAGMKTPDQLVDDLMGQLDELPRLLSSIRDEASLRETTPRISAQVAKINDTMSQALAPGMFSQQISAEKAGLMAAKREQLQKQMAEEGTRIAQIPGALGVVNEVMKIGQIHAVQPFPTAPDAKGMAALPLEEQIKWYMRKKGPSEVYAVVFEGLPPEDLPRIDQRLKSLNMHDGPTVVSGNRCVKYVAPVVKAEMVVNILNVGDARVNAQKRIAVIKVDRAKLQALPPPGSEGTAPGDAPPAPKGT